MITPAPPSILITGANGQLGRALARHFGEQAKAFDRSQLDLSDSQQIQSLCQTLRPKIIINAGAYTAVDQAEIDPGAAQAVNAQAAKVLAEQAKALNAWLIHYSTDYVFEGAGDQPYTESHPCAPQSVYGHSKLAGEVAIAASGAKHLIFRTSWVYAADGANFMLTMLKLAKDRDALTVIDDQWGTPTWVGRLVAVTQLALDRIKDQSDLKPARPPLVPGVYHLCPRGETTWYRYAAKIFEGYPDPARKLKTLSPITSEQYEAGIKASAPNRIVAKRPHNSRMDCAKLEQALNIRMPNWDEDLQQCLAELLPQLPPQLPAH